MLRVGRLQDLLDRVVSYSPWVVALELAVIWVVVYLVVRFVQGTRAAGALKGVLVVGLVAMLLARILSSGDSFARLGWLYERVLGVVAIGLIVIFQPELRRAAVRVGEASLFRASPGEIAQTVSAVVDACTYLSKSRFGAIIVIERQIGLRHLVETGTLLEARLTARLVQTIFFPGSALHDLAVVLHGRRVVAAGVQLPLADPGDMPDPGLGSRHRAAVGVTRETDAIAVVVSEETGIMRVAERGRLSGELDADALRARLTLALQGSSVRSRRPAHDDADIEPMDDSAVDMVEGAAEPVGRN